MEIVTFAPGAIPVTVNGKVVPDPVPTVTDPVPLVNCALPQTKAGFQLVMLTVKPSTVGVDCPKVGMNAKPRGFAVAVVE